MTAMILEPHTAEAAQLMTRTGEIFRISPIHICYFADSATREPFCCAFNKIKGYAGQDPDTFGMQPGTAVHYALDGEGEVEWVELQ